MDWQSRFHRFGYCSIRRELLEMLEEGQVTMTQLQAFADRNKAKVVTKCMSHGIELETALHVGIVKMSPQKEFGSSTKKP